MSKFKVKSLKPLKRPRAANFKFSTCDIEARDWSDFLIIGHYNGKDYKDFLSLSDFMDYCVYQAKENGIFNIWAHFGGIYDFMFLINEVLHNPSFFISEMLPRGSGFLLLKVVHEESGIELIFRDSSAILPFGLKKLSESFNVDHKKQDFDVSNILEVTEELKSYLKDDCRALYEIIQRYESWDLIHKVGVQPTMASQAMKVLRLFMPDEVSALSDEHDALIRPSYFGGRTEIFKPFFKSTKQKLFCYDVNSLYPTIMRENEFPNKLEKTVDYYTNNDMGFFDVTVEVPKMYIPPLPFVLPDQKKLIFPTGVFRGLYTNLELEYAQSLGVNILEVHSGHLFSSSGFLFKDFVDRLYERRLEAIHENDGVGNIICKLLMNSCYGRFGLNKDREELVIDDGGSGLLYHSEIKLNDGSFVYLMKEPKRLDSTFTNVSIPSWVCSGARVKMHKLYMESGPENLYYTDTDSVFTTHEMEVGEGLGKLKKEYECRAACFLLPKTYLVEGVDFKKVAMKGFSNRKIQHFSLEDFETALEGDLRLMKVTHDEKLATFATATRRFHKVLAKLPKQEKKICSLYDKRQLFKKNGVWDSRPLTM